MPLGWANTVCPDITEQRAATYDEVVSGFSNAGGG